MIDDDGNERRLREAAAVRDWESLVEWCRNDDDDYYYGGAAPTVAAAAAVTDDDEQDETETDEDGDSITMIQQQQVQQQQLRQSLRQFLPGPVSVRWLNLAREAVLRAESNPSCTRHVYRSQQAKNNKEVWDITYRNGVLLPPSEDGCEWRMYVDCAGFVRNVLETVLGGEPFAPSLSDRSFMRAKDFYTFFESLRGLPYYRDCDNNGDSGGKPTSCTVRRRDARARRAAAEDRNYWRKISDLWTILPGDLIAYRHQGCAAGGAAFVQNTTLRGVLKAVLVKLAYDRAVQESNDDGGLVDRNLSEDGEVERRVSSLQADLAARRIVAAEDLVGRIGDDDVRDLFERKHRVDTSLVRTALQSNIHDTGHVMFAAGTAEPLLSSTPTTATTANKNNKYQEWRVPVFHSTSKGERQGVQRGYKTFRLDTETGEWFFDGDVALVGAPDPVLAARAFL